MNKLMLTNPKLAHSMGLTRISSLFLNSLIVLSMLSLLMMWVVGQYLQVSLVDLISFAAADQSWVPEGSLQQPAIGVHFFGDYVLGRAWSIHPDPYNLLMPAYPPISLLLFKPFALLPYQMGLVAYLIVSIVIFASAIFAWLNHLPSHVRLMSAGLLTMIVHPSIVSLDRGNQIYMMFGFVAWGFVLWKRERFIWSGILFGTAMALKFYLFPVLLPLLLIGARKIALTAFITGLGATTLLWQGYPGGFTYNIHKFFTEAFAVENAAGSGSIFFQIQQNTLSSGMLQISSFINSSTSPFSFYEQSSFLRSMPLALWLVAITIVSLQRQIPLVVKLSLALSISQHVSSNGSYSALWAVVAGMLLLTSDLHLKFPGVSTVEPEIKRLNAYLLIGLGLVVLANLITIPLSFDLNFSESVVLQIPYFYTYGSFLLFAFELFAIVISVLMFLRQFQNRRVV